MDAPCWIDDARFTINGTPFAVDPVVAALDRLAAGQQPPENRVDVTDATVVYKPRWMIDRYATLDISGSNVVELGILEGGSTALVALLYRPKRLAAIELRPTRLPALDAFITAHDLTDRVHAHFGVDQADTERLTGIVTAEFGAEPLDLVIDDASHQLAPTTSSFNLLFPLLRPGGLYVIEDWSWEYTLETVMAGKTTNASAQRWAAGELDGQDPLSRLILELVLMAAYSDLVVADVTVTHGWALIRRGSAVLDESFDVSQPAGRLARTVLGSRL